MKKLLFVLSSLSFLFNLSSSSAEVLKLNGAGATFPYPLYSKWFDEFKKIDGKIEINYQSLGSGAGIRQIIQKTVDFGASDAPMKDDEIAKVEKGVIHIPTVLGAVVLSYNIPGVSKGLKLTPELVASIFLGKITKWNDPAIVKVNPGVKFPEKADILVATRSDGSGTTAVFTDYLSKVSPEWKAQVGNATSVKWPTGVSGKGNEGVAGLIKQTPGAIGYVELVYALSNGLEVALLQNKAGNFVLPEAKSITAAANSMLKEIPEDFRVSITNAAGKDSYSISSFTYLLVYKSMPKVQGQALKTFVTWALKDGQKLAETLNYAPLPKSMVKNIQGKMDGMKLE
jgi:phosphate transport system substrate-binding protein